MNILKIPSYYKNSTFIDHIKNIKKLSINKKILIDSDDLVNFTHELFKNVNLCDTNKYIVAFGIIYTIECIIKNQNITQPFGININNSKPRFGYEFYDNTGIYHSHILNDKQLDENVVLIWYVIKEDDDIDEYFIKFKYLYHPIYNEYKQILSEIYKEPNSYHIEKGEYFESLHLKNEKLIYTFKNFKI